MGRFTNAATGIIFILFIAGCAGSGSTAVSNNPQKLIQYSQATMSAAQMALDSTAAADARATAQAQAATAQAWLSQTAVAADATREAQIIADAATIEAQAIADQATREAEATRQSLEIEQTAVALQMSIDEATRQAGAVAYAAAVTIAAEETREAQRVLNVEMARAAQVKRDQSALFWANVRYLLTAVLIVVVIIAIIIMVLLAISRVRKVNDQPVQQFRDENQNMNILVIPRGLFSSDVRTIGNPRIAPTPTAGLLPASTQPLIEIKPIKSGHMLIAGNSGSGKSSAMRWAIQHRSGSVVVVDPHAAIDEWNADRVIGRGGDFDGIAAYFQEMRSELKERMAIRGRARNGERLRFPQLTVATDELPAIVSTLGNDGKQAWIEWIEQGRKFGLFVILSSQSTRVKSLGIDGKGDLREQFSAVLSLGSEALRRFPDAASGMNRPAILELENSPNVQRVSIPFVPAFMGSRQELITAGSNGAIIQQPEPANEPVAVPVETAVSGIETDRGFVPADEVQSILDSWKSFEKPSLRKVAKAIYSSTGGIGFYKVRAVLEAHSAL